MKEIGNFIYKNRFNTVLDRHIPMILKPGLIGILFILIWYPLQRYSIYLAKSDSVLTMGVTLITLIYGLISGLVINSNWDKYRAISLCVVTQNKSEFLKRRDEKMPLMLHILLGGMAVSIQMFFMVIKYENIEVGIMCIFNSAFFLCLIGIIAYELDNPIRSIWFQKKVPQEWLDENIEDYFKKLLKVAEQQKSLD